MAEQYSSTLAGRRLQNALGLTDAFFNLNTVPSGLGPGTYRFRIDAELLTGNYSGSGLAFTNLQRGLEGTATANHRAGVLVRHVFTGDSVQKILSVQTQDDAASLEGVRALVMPNDELTFSDTIAIYRPLAGVSVVFDGGGSPIQAGAEIDVQLPWDLAVDSATLLADQVGSIEIDLWRATYANYPPSITDSICHGVFPALSSAIKNTMSIIGWTTALRKGDVVRVHVNSATTVTRVTLAINGERSVPPRGTIVATLPSLTANLIAVETFSGTVAGTLPHLAAAIS